MLQEYTARVTISPRKDYTSFKMGLKKEWDLPTGKGK